MKLKKRAASKSNFVLPITVIMITVITFAVNTTTKLSSRFCYDDSLMYKSLNCFAKLKVAVFDDSVKFDCKK